MQHLVVIVFLAVLNTTTGQVSEKFREVHNPSISEQTNFGYGYFEEASADVEGTDIFPDYQSAIDRCYKEGSGIPGSVYRFHHSNPVSLQKSKLLPRFIDLPPPSCL